MKRLATLTAMLIVLALSATAQGSVTIGSLPSSTTTGACTFCGGVQASDSGPNTYTAPVRGVVTSFSVRSGTVLNSADKYRLNIYAPATPPNWTFAAAGDFVTWPNTSATYADKPVSWNTRLPILPGEHIGLELHDSGGNTASFFSTLSTSDVVFGPADTGFSVGSTSTSGSTFTKTRENVTATIETDADLDGYGDETQDGCPGDRADHGPCTAPLISGFKFSLNKFTVNNGGSVLSPTKAAAGTSIIETLSKTAHVSFVLNLKATGRKVGKSCVKQTSKNRKKKCTYYPKFFHFERDLPAGTSNLGFSGRIKVKSKTKTLPVGSYVATAYPFSIQAQLGGPIAKTTFKVVRATSPH